MFRNVQFFFATKVNLRTFVHTHVHFCLKGELSLHLNQIDVIVSYVCMYLCILIISMDIHMYINTLQSQNAFY